MKRIISIIICLILLLSITIGVSGFSVNAATVDVEKTSSNQTNIVDRADYMYNATWTCLKTMTAYCYSSYYTFYAGNTYHLPYGQPTSSGEYIGLSASVDTFLASTKNASSVFYTVNSTNSYRGSYAPYYATDCSGFVSYCWDVSQQSTRSIANISTYIGSVTTHNCTYNLQLGDALNRYDYHVVLVTGLEYDSNGAITQIEITEQTIPDTKRSYYTPAELAATYSNYNGIYRYYGTVSPAPAKDEWVSDGTGLKYKYSNGTYASGWTKIDGEDYYFGGGNYMYTGWLNDGGNRYFFNPYNGIMQRGWYQVEGIWYYFNSDGVMQTGWVQPDSGGDWYYLNEDGSMATGWIMPDGITTYYMDPNSGAMATGWTSIDGVYHEFSLWGVYYHNTAVDLGNNFTAVITTNADNNKALSLSENNVVIRTREDTDDQIWKFEKQSDGSYKIINQGNQFCLDVQDASTSVGANVQTWKDNGETAQRWIITLDEGCEGYTLRPVNAVKQGRVVDVLNAETADGTNVVLSNPNGGTNQQFTIIRQEMIGDADKDGELSIADVTYIQEFVAGIITDTNENVLADVNGNGKIDIRDATYIQMYLAKVINKFPCEAPVGASTEQTASY